jgi:hypothetical protein
MKRIGLSIPDVFARLLPELPNVEMPEETRATCARCAMAPEYRVEKDHPNSFTSPERCCTYIPTLANFMVGRILRRGDTGTLRMLERLKQVDGGVTAFGVSANPEQAAFYGEHSGNFGSLPDYRCPYWVGGERACSIWADRNAVCRTWHCRYIDGTRGYSRWSALRRALDPLEGRVAAWCVATSKPPEPGADRDLWIAWYLHCAARVDATDSEVLRGLLVKSVHDAMEVLSAPLPEQPVPEILMSSPSDWRVREDRVELFGYSTFDAFLAPSWIFAFLSRLDGRTTWAHAASALEAETGHRVDETMIRAMLTHGVLFEPAERYVDVKPGQSVHFGPPAGSVVED